MRAVFVATAFLTRVPLRVVADGADVGRAVRWFPFVGGGIGAAVALLAWGMRDLLGLPPALTATLLIAAGAWVTGAIHLDGLADVADGFGGGRTKDDVLRIMRDPVIGSFGATALALLITTKLTALAVLLERDAAIPYLLVAPAIARWTIAVLAAALPYARTEAGLGRAVVGGDTTVGLIVATATTALIATASVGPAVVVPWGMAASVMALLARTARRRIGGVTGDLFGASVEISETAVLLGGVLLTGWGW